MVHYILHSPGLPSHRWRPLSSNVRPHLKPVPTISDRRAHTRHAFRTDVLVLMPGGRQGIGQALDIGRGGMAIVADINPTVGSGMAIHLTLPARPSGSAVFEARVLVANCVLDGAEGGFRIGLQFLALEPAVKLALANFLA